MKKLLFALLVLIGIGSAHAQSDSLITPQAKAFADLRLGMFIHFGINTYTPDEWTDGTVPMALYNPAELDTDQWCAAAKSAGMKYVVFTAKHHEGFCNWPTKYTDYSVKNTPYKKDVIKQLAASCAKYDLKLGLYYSLWDRNFPDYKDQYKYTEYMKNQLEELLTNYGDILLIWFDGVWDKFGGLSSPTAEQMMQAWRNNGTYNWQWDQIYAFIKHTSPNTLVMNNSGLKYPGIPLLPTDVRSGEKATKTAANNFIWNFAGKKVYIPMQIEDIVSQKYWFFHKGDTTVKTKQQIELLINNAADMKANLLLNVGPMENGKLREQDVELLNSLAK